MTDETKKEAGASERSGAPLELNEAQRSGEAPASFFVSSVMAILLRPKYYLIYRGGEQLI